MKKFGFLAKRAFIFSLFAFAVVPSLSKNEEADLARDTTRRKSVQPTDLSLAGCDFLDDFNDNQLDGWTAYNASRWSTKTNEGDYALWLNTSSYNSPTEDDLGEVITIDNLVVSNFTFECRLKSDEGAGNTGADLALIFGYQDTKNYYYAILNRGTSRTELRRLQNGMSLSLDEYNPGVLADNNWHQVKLTFLSGTIEVFYDSQLILSGRDLTFTSGKVGVGSKNDSGWFDNVCLSYASSSSNIQITFNQVDPSNFPKINCYVSVTDNSGNPIVGLDKSNFSATENGRTQAPITVTPGGLNSAQVSIALVLDRSGSMTSGSQLQDAKTAAISLVNTLGSNDRAAVISFASTVSVDQGFTSSKAAVTSAINKLYASGTTAFYDAIVTGVTQSNAQSGRKAIIALTDGYENASTSSLDGCINQARAAGLPVFTIGLGTVEAAILQKIANETGGRYFYAPTSADLLQIYQLISQQLQNQYLISYTTSNPAFDCTTRDVQITVTAQSGSDTKTRSYQSPCAVTAPIYPSSPSATCYAGLDFWLEIKVGSSSQPVSNLFAVSFLLNYPTSWLDVVYPAANNVIAGSFIGNDLVFFQDVNESGGLVSVGVSRKSGAGGVSGSGPIARIHLTSSSATPNNTNMDFTLSSISAIDPNGSPIILTPQTFAITITSGATVWPGDTYNDGYVDQSDILPLGVYFNKTGTPRSSAPNNHWQAQPCTALWNPSLATYADCDGNGVINQADVFAIGLNWHKSHTVALVKASPLASINLAPGKASIYPLADSTIRPNSEFQVAVKVRDVSDLFGIAFQLAVDDTEYVTIREANLGNLLGSDILALPPMIDSTLNIISIGMTRKAGQGGVTDSGTILLVKMKMSAMTPKGKKIVLRIDNLKATDNTGAPIELVALSDTILVNTAATGTQRYNETAGLLDHYILAQNFPNPFNTSTIITYELPQAAHVRMTIHNTEGKLVHTLIDGPQKGGVYSLHWDGTDEKGMAVSAGMYFCFFSADHYSKTLHMLLIR